MYFRTHCKPSLKLICFSLLLPPQQKKKFNIAPHRLSGVVIMSSLFTICLSVCLSLCHRLFLCLSLSLSLSLSLCHSLFLCFSVSLFLCFLQSLSTKQILSWNFTIFISLNDIMIKIKNKYWKYTLPSVFYCYNLYEVMSRFWVD